MGMVNASSDRIAITKPDCIADIHVYATAFEAVCDHFKDGNQDGLELLTSSTRINGDSIEATCSYKDTKNNDQKVLFTTEVAQALGGDKK
ncbi:uncharacterized protein I303_100062 [Kwoniella dejecticola CBS 10117]|uniref:Uncharacterized protein n=1 Tax=Kwoniella dejecticola CBS 10117 TaxID=1296121 RepID=A0A1A6ADV3_9TREE|nr:uncharacterized protein I303_00062 [Kwoniella dejecticola CBS 10117]OBR88251.1 hypothetical protein I303_00062 [Kwoniella dejecticola CBS 10117]